MELIRYCYCCIISFDLAFKEVTLKFAAPLQTILTHWPCHAMKRY